MSSQVLSQKDMDDLRRQGYSDYEINQAIREVEKALGEVSYELTDKMKKSREFSRSLFIVEDMEEGEVFSEKNIRSIRPGFGLYPKYLKDVLGKRVAKAVTKGTPLDWDLIK